MNLECEMIKPVKKDITVPWIRTGSVHGRYIVTSKLTGELLCEVHRESIADKIICYANEYDQNKDDLLKFSNEAERTRRELTALKKQNEALLEVAHWVAAGHASCQDIIEKAQKAI